jgi:3-phenylpropionate/cinnamic acid dioxygenase small subunit
MNVALNTSVTRVPVGSPAYSEVAEWLYLEARLLDCGDFSAWLALISKDIAYEMPTRTTVLPKQGSGFHYEFGLFSDNFSSLSARVKRLQTDQAWAEQPRSRTRHFVSNLLIERDAKDAFYATSSVLVTRMQADRPVDLFSGERLDVLRREDSALKLLRRQILLDQTVLESHNLSVLF